MATVAHPGAEPTYGIIEYLRLMGVVWLVISGSVTGLTALALALAALVRYRLLLLAASFLGR